MGNDALHVFGTVIRLVVDLREGECSVVPQRLQGAWTDVQHPAHVLIVHPLTHRLFAVPMADGIHAADEPVELDDHRLKSSFLD